MLDSLSENHDKAKLLQAIYINCLSSWRKFPVDGKNRNNPGSILILKHSHDGLLFYQHSAKFCTNRCGTKIKPESSLSGKIAVFISQLSDDYSRIIQYTRSALAIRFLYQGFKSTNSFP